MAAKSLAQAENSSVIPVVEGDFPERQEFLAMSTDELRVELTRSLDMTAQSLRRLALIVRTLDERGIDLSDLKLGLLTYLRQIAYGHVIPEVVVRFAEAPSLIQRIAALPAPDQRSLAGGEPVDLVVREADGSFGRRRADPLKMTGQQIYQVFGRGRLRDEAEQILYLQGRKEETASAKSPAKKVGRVTVDGKRGGIRVGKVFVPAGDAIKALAELRESGPSEPDAERDTPVTFKVTELEGERLKLAAMRAGNIGVNNLVYRAVAACGLFAGPGLDDLKGK